MAKKKKTEKIGTISGMYLLKHSRGPEKVPFRQEAFKNKKKENKRVTITKHNMDKFM